MRIVSINVNGIRSAQKKGVFEWLETINADIICLQELKADEEAIPAELKNITGYHCYYHSAKKKGYSGVGILSKVKPQQVIIGLNNQEIDDEGRYIELVFANDLHIASIYMPSGSSGEDKQQKKFRMMEYYMPILKQQTKEKNFIICGDWNIAHQELDIKNWKGNLKNSGFLPEERSWLTELFANGYIDSYRQLYPESAGYTWWSNRGNAYANDVGWRIDYQIVSDKLLYNITHAEIYKDIKFSDHAPLIVDYTIKLSE